MQKKVPRRLRMQFQPCLDSVDAFAEPGFTCKTSMSIQVLQKHQKLFLCSDFSTHNPFQECAEKVSLRWQTSKKKFFCQLHGIKGRVLSFSRQKELFKTDIAAVLGELNMGKTRRKSAGTTPRRRRRRGGGVKKKRVRAAVVVIRKKPRKRSRRKRRATSEKRVLRGLSMISVQRARKTPRRRQRLGPAATGLVDGFSRLRVTGPHNTRVGRAA